MSLAVALAAMLVAQVGSSDTLEAENLTRVRDLRLQGALAEAQLRAEKTLATASADPELRIDLHLELFRIHDRRGLHNNTRPVGEALQEIEAAASVTADPSPAARARIELARAEYHYRAEMQERKFPRATAHAERARALFRELGDRHGEADAVHKQGLIFFQRRELARARELFDLSLELDRAGGERPYFRGDYERHVGYVFVLEGDTESSVPCFERSLAFRRQAGAVDASLFAANTLASALVDVGRLDEARSPLLYATLLAEKLDSPAARARNGLVLGQLYEKAGDTAAALQAFETTLGIANSIGYGSIARQSNAALERLRSD